LTDSDKDKIELIWLENNIVSAPATIAAFNGPRARGYTMY